MANQASYWQSITPKQNWIFSHIYHLQSSNWIRHSAWIRRLGVRVPPRSLKNFDTFTRTPVHVSNINAVARPIKKYLYRQSQCSNTWDSKCLVLIAQMVRAFGMNPPQVQTFSVSKKLWHFHKNTRSCVENECCCPRTVNISIVNFTSKISFAIIKLSETMLTPKKHLH